MLKTPLFNHKINHPTVDKSTTLVAKLKNENGRECKTEQKQTFVGTEVSILNFVLICTAIQKMSNPCQRSIHLRTKIYIFLSNFPSFEAKLEPLITGNSQFPLT